MMANRDWVFFCLQIVLITLLVVGTAPGGTSNINDCACIDGNDSSDGDSGSSIYANEVSTGGYTSIIRSCRVNCENMGLTEFPKQLPWCTRVLNLTDNDITTINEDDFLDLPNLQTLVLNGNPLNCTCDLMWLAVLISKRENLTIEGAVCGSPSQVQNTSLADLKNTLDCSEFIWVGDEVFIIRSNNYTNWEDANTTCNAEVSRFGLTGHLAILRSRDLLDHVTFHLWEYFARNSIEFWIGCNDWHTDGSFRWIDNTCVDSDLWTPTPGNNCNNNRRFCCQLWHNTGNIFIDDVCDCNKDKRSICQIGNIDEYPTNAPGDCDEPTVSASPLTSRVNTTVGYDGPTTTLERRSSEMTTTPVTTTNPATTKHRDATRERLENLANATILPEQARNASQMLRNLTSKASTFEETDVNLSVDLLGSILQSQGNGTDVTIATNVLQTVDNLLSVDEEVLMASQSNQHSATRLLQTVEQLSQLLEFDNESVTIETPSIILTVALINLTDFGGLSFAVSQTGQTGLSTEADESPNDISSSIQLPSSLFETFDQTPNATSQAGRAQFHVYKSNKFFKAVDERTPTGFSPVVAASIGRSRITNLREPVKIRLAHHNSYNNTLNISCEFWDYNLNDYGGAWSDRGCVVSSDTESDDGNATVCECDHLTNFALLVDIYGDSKELDASNKKALSIISYIGCLVSLLALTVTLLSLLAYRRKKDKNRKILQNLCFALFMALLMFLIGSFAVDFAPIVPGICITVAVLLHYFLLAVMLWMALEAAQMYLMLVKVFETYITHFMVKFCLIGWGVPLIIVVVTIAVDVDNYGYHNTICWLSRYPFFGAFLAPLCLVLVFNTIVYCLVIYQICGLNSKAMTSNERFSTMAQLRAAIGLMVLLGLTWVFAIFAVGEASLLFNYLFAIFNSLQGLFIFVFHCATKQNIRNGWRKTFCGGKGAAYRKDGHGDTTSSVLTSSTGGLKYQSETTDTDLKLDLSTTTSGEQTYNDNEKAMSTFKEYPAAIENEYTFSN